MSNKKVILSDTKIIELNQGNVLHAMKSTDEGFCSFGEAYFSCINPGAIKAWKRHKKMTLNIIVPIGEIRFILFDEEKKFLKEGSFQEFILSQKNYKRLTVPPKIWMGFQCLSKEQAMLLNIANIAHDDTEVESVDINEINFDWSLGK